MFIFWQYTFSAMPETCVRCHCMADVWAMAFNGSHSLVWKVLRIHKLEDLENSVAFKFESYIHFVKCCGKVQVYFINICTIFEVFKYWAEMVKQLTQAWSPRMKTMLWLLKEFVFVHICNNCISNHLFEHFN